MPEQIELNDRGVLIRPLHRTDRARYVEAVNSLSPRSRYLRFASPIRSLSDRAVDRLMDADGQQHVVLVALEAEVIIAVGRYVVTEPRLGEMAMAVTDRWQRQGLGRVLLDRLVGRGRKAGLSRLVATTLAENGASRRLLDGAGFIVWSADGLMVTYGLGLA